MSKIFFLFASLLVILPALTICTKLNHTYYLVIVMAHCALQMSHEQGTKIHEN